MPLVVFDALGTLFDLEPARQKLVEIGAPAAALEAWFERLLHTALALTTVGEFRPFAEIAEATLQTTLAQRDLDESSTADVLACLESLDAYDDAAPALERLGAAGVRIVTLTNGGGEQTKALLERAGVLEHVERVFSVKEVRAYKPDPRTYRHVLDRLQVAAGDATLIAAHAWDVVGAQAVGMQAIWVARLERRWPLPLPQAETVASLVEAVEHVLTGTAREAAAFRR
jgi:2-haloacid dehalogenase